MAEEYRHDIHTSLSCAAAKSQLLWLAVETPGASQDCCSGGPSENRIARKNMRVRGKPAFAGGLPSEYIVAPAGMPDGVMVASIEAGHIGAAQPVRTRQAGSMTMAQPAQRENLT